MSVVDQLRRPRLRRLAQFVSVGLVGMGVDIAVTFAALGHVHYLLANAAGWSVAVSHNFVGNYVVTYGRPEGSAPRQYLSYVSLHAVTFALRAAVIAIGVEAAALPATMATAVGIGVASLTNFVGAEAIFGAAGDLRFNLVAALNQIAHVVYSSRLRQILRYAGLYNPILWVYTQGLSRANPVAERPISVGGASAVIKTEQPTETVSVMHTLEKEHDILREFVDEVQPSDHVVDVGANLGVFSALGSDIGASVTAVEAHPPTADRCEDNLPPRATVIGAALGDESGTVSLAVEQDAVGTQRPSVAESGQWTVDQLPGDDLDAPDVLKVDVEGAEVAVLDGFEATLAGDGPRTIFVECHGETEAPVRQRLSAAGYSIETLHLGGETYLRADDPGHSGEDADSSNSKQC